MYPESVLGEIFVDQVLNPEETEKERERVGQFNFFIFFFILYFIVSTCTAVGTFHPEFHGKNTEEAFGKAEHKFFLFLIDALMVQMFTQHGGTLCSATHTQPRAQAMSWNPD